MKTSGFLVLILSYAAVSAVAATVTLRHPVRQRRRAALTSACSKVILHLLGVRVTVRHRERIPAKGPGRLVVANHVSSLDVPILSSLAPVIFITSVELGKTPFLGLLARSGGSIFVERRNPSGLRREIAAIVGSLRAGLPVALFPEGTTSKGDGVMPFKNSLFDAAVRAGTDVQPVCIRYLTINGKKVSSANRDSAFYHGTMSFARHALGVLGCRSIHAEVTVLPMIPAAPGSSRKELAARAHRAVADAYKGQPFKRSDLPRSAEELSGRHDVSRRSLSPLR
jgi:1-acyl-sn-glycerol-3-phosphate acyltransferase